MDEAHKATDWKIREIENRIKRVYADAQKDLEKKAKDFWERHEKRSKKYLDQVKKGEITEEQYQNWMHGQVFQGKQWESKKAQIAQILTNADKVSQQIINGEIYGVFANNANWMSYSIEHGAGLNFGFELYDASTVAKLLKEQPELLPKYRLDIPADMEWNQKLITQQITQGIIQGEDIFQIAKRMANVTDRDENLCLTRARTAMTAAENAGRQESLTRAKSMGIKAEKEWLATLDGHTRTQHARLDGQHVPTDKPFKIDGYEIEFPGDPHAHPAMRYNCRCTMVGRLVDYPDMDAERYDNIDGKPIKNMSYFEWEKAKSVETVKNVQISWENIPEEITSRMKTIDSLITELTGKKSVYNGKVIVDHSLTRYNGTANYDGSITLKKGASTKTQIHEMLHQHSEGGQNKMNVYLFKNYEEGSVELMAQEICRAKNIRIGDFDYAYGKYVNALRKINELSGKYKTDYDFALAVFQQPLDKRKEFLLSLKSQVDKKNIRLFNAAMKDLG